MTVGRTTSTDAPGQARRARELTLANAEVQREFLASHLGVSVEKMKPCVALLGRVPEGRRQECCRVLVIECLRAGASEEAIRGHMGFYVENQCEQPPIASHPYTHREASSTVKSVFAKAKRERIRGYGCKSDTNPLKQFCLFRDNYKVCPYVLGLFRQPKREGISTVLGALNLLTSHKTPSHWTERERMRRALLMWTVAALEQAKGYGGAELITSERELTLYLPGRVTPRTVRGDLQALADEKQIRWVPGESRRGRAGLPPMGMRITRLLPPGPELLRDVLETFAGSTEAEE